MNDRTDVTAGIITCSTQMCFLDTEGPATAILTDLRYDPSDPYAMTVAFHTPAKTVTWTFGRELLISGLHEPTGVGDVQVWPSLEETGTAVVMIELFSPGGDVMLQAPSRVIADFTARMLAAVPLGAESVDVDAELAHLR